MKAGLILIKHCHELHYTFKHSPVITMVLMTEMTIHREYLLNRWKIELYFTSGQKTCSM